MTYTIAPLFCRPWTLNGIPARLIESHYENNYGGAVRRLNQLSDEIKSLAPTELARLQRKMQREYEAVRGIDFFASEASIEAEAAWTDFNRRIEERLSPDEPHETKGRIPRLDVSKYQARTWATRRRYG